MSLDFKVFRSSNPRKYCTPSQKKGSSCFNSNCFFLAKVCFFPVCLDCVLFFVWLNLMCFFRKKFQLPRFSPRFSSKKKISTEKLQEWCKREGHSTLDEVLDFLDEFAEALGYLGDGHLRLGAEECRLNQQEGPSNWGWWVWSCMTPRGVFWVLKIATGNPGVKVKNLTQSRTPIPDFFVFQKSCGSMSLALF